MVGLVTANLGALALAAMLHLGRPRPFAWLEFVGFSLAFAAVTFVPMRLHFSQHRATLTLTDGVLVVALFHLGGVWPALAAASGEALHFAIKRTSTVKAVFNVASQAGAAAVAAAVFAAIPHGSSGPAAWLTALGAVACWSAMNAASVAVVISRAEHRSLRRTAAQAMPAAMATSALAGSLGLLMVELVRQGAAYPALLLPLALGIWLNNRYAAGQRDEHLRIERLYGATRRTAQLAQDDDVPGSIAEEARRLLTGEASLCYLSKEGEPWVGRSARQAGTGGARKKDIEQLLKAGTVAPGEALATSVPDHFRELAPAADVMVMTRSPQGSSVDLVIAVFRRRSGDRQLEAGVAETLVAFGAHATAMATNVRLLQDLRRSLEAELAANQRKDEFVATISHELRTPLTVLLGSAETLLKSGDRVASDLRDRLLVTALDQGQRLKLLIEDLLTVAAAEQGTLHCDMSTISTTQMLADVEADLPEGFRPWVTFANRAPGAAASTDRFKFRQILSNLLANAAKYAAGSYVEIVVAPGDPGTLAVAVVDHGPGIPGHARHRVFERFSQLDQSSTRTRGGTGLGLFISRRLAEHVGAQLELSDTAGGGCTFTLSLPSHDLRRSGDAPAAVTPSPEQKPELRRRPDCVPALAQS